MSDFALARPDDPRGPYVWLTDNRTPDNARGNERGFVLAWGFTIMHDGVYDDPAANAHCASLWEAWVQSEDLAAAVAYIESWVNA